MFPWHSTVTCMEYMPNRFQSRHPSIHASIYPSIHLFIHPSIYRSIFHLSMAGTATHLGKTGVFCIASQNLALDLSLESGFQHARDRSTNVRCSEWKQFGSPSAWSVSVVLAFHHDTNDITACDTVADVRKYVIPRQPGTVVTPGFLTLLVDKAEFLAWRSLHELGNLEFNSNCLDRRILYSQYHSPIMMCGGKEHDPFFSCRHPRMPSSCGRTCPIHMLESTWLHAKNRPAYDRIWYCPLCFH